MCVFITAGPITKLCAWGEEESGGHVQEVHLVLAREKMTNLNANFYF